MAIYLLDLDTKISTVPIFIDDVEDLTETIATEEPYNPKYKYAWDRVQLVEMPELAIGIEKNLQDLREMMQVTIAAVVTERTSTEIALVQKIVFGLSFPRFMVANEEANLRCFRVWRNPQVQDLKNVWNLPEYGAINECMTIILPKIRHAVYFYIPRAEDPKRTLLTGSRKAKPNSYKSSVHYEHEANIFQRPADHPANSVRILLLSANNLQFHENANTCSDRLFKFCCPCMESPLDYDFETIMIYIHGGGFIACSCESVQIYTREWAN